MEKNTIQFAVIKEGGVIRQIGRSQGRTGGERREDCLVPVQRHHIKNPKKYA